MTTEKPWAISFFTVSGTAATRVSAARRSLVTAMTAICSGALSRGGLRRPLAVGSVPGVRFAAQQGDPHDHQHPGADEAADEARGRAEPHHQEQQQGRKRERTPL